MNEVAREVKAYEIHKKAESYYQASEQFGYKFLMEIKTIRDETLYIELGFKDFEEYTLNVFGYSRNSANEKIAAAVSWGEEYNRALGSYGKTKTYQLSQLPKPDRKRVVEHGVPTDEGIKPIQEATTRELEEYKKQLKQRDEQIENLSDAVKEMVNQKPTVIEKETVKEVFPANYEHLQSDNEQLQQALKEARKNEREALEAVNQAKNNYSRLLQNRAETEENSEKYKQLTEAIQAAQSNLNDKQRLISNYQNLSQLLRTSNEFLSKASSLVYQDLSEVVSGDGLAKKELEFLIERTERFLSDLRKQINQKNIIEGEIIDE